ncbi:hypothetical protein B0H19DRAFT_868001, partial [Mycena capillaripes]
LQTAALSGDPEIVRILADHRTYVNAKGRFYGIALPAVFKKHTEIIRLLIDRGADVNAQGGYFGNALHA